MNKPHRQALAGAVLFAIAQAHAGAPAAKVLAPGAHWEVARTTTLAALTIGAGASVAATPGHSVTLTVDGVQRDLAPGGYRGQVVLTVTEAVDLKMSQARGSTEYRAALFVDHGKVQAGRSVRAAVTGGKVDDAGASDVRIRSRGAKFNGVIVTGDSRYVLRNPVIEFEGNGGNDMAGWGAAVLAADHADVTLDHARITTRGAARSALFVAGHGTVHVRDSEIETYNGTLGPDDKSPWEGGSGPMMEVPWMLGLTGNVRSTNVIESGTVYYDNSHFRSQGWGVLSTDGPENIHMVVTNSTIDALESGYGAYTIGNSLDTFSHCTFNVAEVGVIVTGFGSTHVTDGTIINSRRFGMMMHTNDGKFGTVTVDKGSEINSRSTAFAIKGRGVKIVVDGAHVNPGNGLLIEAFPNEDPFVGGYGTQATVDAMLDGEPGSEKIGGLNMGEDAAPPPGTGAPPAAGAPAAGSGPPGMGAPDYSDPGGKLSGPVLATFRNTTVAGDIVQARTQQGGMEVLLEAANLRGAITTAVAETATHKAPSKAKAFLLGEVRNVFQPTHDKYGLSVKLDGAARWTIDQTSYLTRLELAPGARIEAPAGFRLALLVDGSERPLAAGTHAGRVELRVSPL